MRIGLKKVDFIFCSFFPVGLDDYVDYFKKKFDEFTYLRWKFPHSKDEKSYSSIKYYTNGNLKKEKKLLYFSANNKKINYFLLLPISYIIYLLQAIFFLGLVFKKTPGRKTIFMGINYFCTFCGILLKKIGKVDYVIYRVMDFFPMPPNGFYRQVNKFFYFLDKYCLKNSDAIWFTTEGHLIGREKYGYFDRKNFQYQMIPLGIDTKKFVSAKTGADSKFSLVYCGVISRYHLLDLVFEVVAQIKKKFKKIKLNIIGSGPDIDYFKDQAKKMNLEENIIFHGFMEDSPEFRRLMANNVLGIALYKDEENFMKYTEPAKVKYYLSFGVPAIVSRVPVIADELDKKRVCFAVNNNKDEVVKTIEKFILDDKMQEEYFENIKKFVKTIDTNKLLDRAFLTTFAK